MAKPVFSKRIVLAFIAATLAGICLHFLYRCLPNPVTALVSPVNESIWEHLKLIYWPYLVAMELVTGKAGRGVRGSWMFSLLVVSVAMLAAGYVYHISLGGDSVAVDVGIYVVLMALAFWLPGRLKGSGGHSAPVFFLTVLLGVALVLFTFLPPGFLLFADLSGVRTWETIPY